MAATLLLADDSVTIQRVIELTFANEGVRVITAADGQVATARIEDSEPDIVLVDVGLPGVDGYVLTERVKRSSALARVPVLLLAGAFEPIDETRARASGCDGVVVKPFDPTGLVAMVKALLAGERPDNLWPTDMPRIEPPVEQPAFAPPQALPERARVVVPEPASRPPLSAMEDVFELGLDDLDLAFSRLDPLEPVAPVGRLDADAASDSRLDIEERPSTPVEDAEWDLPAPRISEPVAPPPPAPPPSPTVEPPVAVPSVPEPLNVPPVLPMAPPSLATAFSALLAAEQAQPMARPSQPPVSALSDAAVEEVVRRVVTRMTDEVVRKVVMETADRLIREELDRLKQ